MTTARQPARVIALRACRTVLPLTFGTVQRRTARGARGLAAGGLGAAAGGCG